MIRRVLLFLIVVCGATVGFAADETVSIRPGETITLQLMRGEFALVDRREADPISSFEARLTEGFAREVAPPGATVLPPVPIYNSPVPPPPIRPEQVRITFRQVPGRSILDLHSLLTIQNGYDRSFRFRAVMQSGSKSAPTDVCEVFPGKYGLEHWPYRIERLELSALRLEAERKGYARCE